MKWYQKIELFLKIYTQGSNIFDRPILGNRDWIFRSYNILEAINFHDKCCKFIAKYLEPFKRHDYRCVVGPERERIYEVPTWGIRQQYLISLQRANCRI